MDGGSFPVPLRTAFLKLLAVAVWVELFKISYWLGYGLQDPGFEFSKSEKFFSFPTCPNRILGPTNPTIHQVPVAVLLSKAGGTWNWTLTCI